MIRDAAVYMLVMGPSGWEPFTVGYDLDGDDWIADVPTGAGVYLLYTPGHFFMLPGGGTSVRLLAKVAHCGISGHHWAPSSAESGRRVSAWSGGARELNGLADRPVPRFAVPWEDDLGGEVLQGAERVKSLEGVAVEPGGHDLGPGPAG